MNERRQCFPDPTGLTHINAQNLHKFKQDKIPTYWFCVCLKKYEVESVENRGFDRSWKKGKSMT